MESLRFFRARSQRRFGFSPTTNRVHTPDDRALATISEYLPGESSVKGGRALGLVARSRFRFRLPEKFVVGYRGGTSNFCSGSGLRSGTKPSAHGRTGTVRTPDEDEHQLGLYKSTIVHLRIWGLRSIRVDPLNFVTYEGSSVPINIADFFFLTRIAPMK
jgi:hypothetical protein